MFMSVLNVQRFLQRKIQYQLIDINDQDVTDVKIKKSHVILVAASEARRGMPNHQVLPLYAGNMSANLAQNQTKSGEL